MWSSQSMTNIFLERQELGAELLCRNVYDYLQDILSLEKRAQKHGFNGAPGRSWYYWSLL